MIFRAVLRGAFLCLALTLPSQAATSRELLASGIGLIEHASQVWDKAEMVQAADLFRQASDLSPVDALPFYWLGVASFHQASFFLYARPKDRDPHLALQQVEAGIKALDQALTLDPKDPESHALRGVLTGMKVQLYFWSVFTLGPRIEADRNQALALDPKNPRIHYLTATSLWFAPEIFGNRGLALEHLHKAEALFAAEAQRPGDPLRPRWGQAHNLAFLGDAYLARGDRERARAYYLKAIEVSPQSALASERLAELGPDPR